MSESLTTLMEKARGTKKMTLRELSQKVKCTPSFLSEIENCVRPIPKDAGFLTKLAEALDLNVDAVIESANRERKARSPRRLRDLLKNQELAACYYRLNESNITDEQLCDALVRAMRELEEKNANG